MEDSADGKLLGNNFPTTAIYQLAAPSVPDSAREDVMRDIRSLIDQGTINGSSFGLVKYMDAKGESRPIYHLDFKATMTLVTGYDAKRRSSVNV